MEHLHLLTQNMYIPAIKFHFKYQIAFTLLNLLYHIHMANMKQPQKQFSQIVLYLQQKHHVSFKVVK